MGVRRFGRVAALAIGVVLAAGCSRDLSSFIPPAGKYDVRILRDDWGVPHIFGKSDADVAYGLGYAHSEDDWTNIENAFLTARGRLASARGIEWAKFDYIAQWFQVREYVEQRYEEDLSAETRAVLEGYAEGVTHFAALNPDKMPDLALPVTGKDVAAVSTLLTPFFYSLEEDLAKVLDPGGATIGKDGVQITKWLRSNPFAPEGTIGSNAWAVGRNRSADGAVRMAINSHMPWEGPVTFYEAHLHSEEGWNMIGGTFPGGPMIFLGHDANKGWCHTISRPDLCDTYDLEMNPDNPYQYKFDGEWRDLDRRVARLTVKLFGPIRLTLKQEMLWSVHGPALRDTKPTWFDYLTSLFRVPTPKKDAKVYAFRFAGYGTVGSLEEWFRMNKARNLEEFRDAMRLLKIPSFNTLYADKDGNSFYVYNGRFPVRTDGFDWKGVLPGNTSDDVWTELLPFDALPQVTNPPSGFIQTCNSTPFHTTDGEGNPPPESFPAWMGIETHLTNRSMRALDTYGADPSITRDEFYAYKFDKTYSEGSKVAAFVKEALAADPGDDPLLKQALELLGSWDRTTAKDNRAAALAMAAFERKGGKTPLEAVREAAQWLMKFHKRIDPPWQEVLRLRRGKLSLGLGGGPDCLRAVDIVDNSDGTFRGVNGDCYFLLLEWDKDGNLRSEDIHQYGSGTVDTKSPHYDDQAPLFANEKMRPTLLTEEAIRAHLDVEYRPGMKAEPWCTRKRQ